MEPYPAGDRAATDALAAAVEELALNPQAPEYFPPPHSSTFLSSGPAIIASMPSAPHPQLYSMPLGPMAVTPGASWPYLGCEPLSQGHTRFGWAPPPGVGPLNFIPHGCSYGYSGASTGQAGHQAHSAGFAGWGSSGTASHLRERPSSGHHGQAMASSWVSNGSAAVCSAATYADEMRGFSGRGGSRAPRVHDPEQQDQGQPANSPKHSIGSSGQGDSTFEQSVPHGNTGGGSMAKGPSGPGGKRSRRGADFRMRPMSQGDVQAHIARTVYICDVEKNVSEEMLAQVFSECGAILDVRVCGDANQDLRFAFLEFQELQSVDLALRTMAGREVAGYPLRVSRSKTAIAPVNIQFLPRSTAEREQCSRTVYVSNLDKSVDREQLILWFQKFAGPVSAIRMKSDVQQRAGSRIAFVEFCAAEDAQRALRECSGSLLGLLPVRIAPSKTPLRLEPSSRDRRS